MFGTLHQLINVKVKNMTAQKYELETALTKRSNCRSFVRDSLRTASQGEVMKMKSTVTKQIKEMTPSFKPDMLTPWLLQQTYPEKCYAEGKGLEVAKCGERATAVLHLVDECEKACSTPMETVSCELVAVPKKIDCSVKKEGDSQYAISYQTSSPGKYQLHVKVEGEHIKGSPFPVMSCESLAIRSQLLARPK